MSKLRLVSGWGWLQNEADQLTTMLLLGPNLCLLWASDSLSVTRGLWNRSPLFFPRLFTFFDLLVYPTHAGWGFLCVWLLLGAGGGGGLASSFPGDGAQVPGSDCFWQACKERANSPLIFPPGSQTPFRSKFGCCMSAKKVWAQSQGLFIARRKCVTNRGWLSVICQSGMNACAHCLLPWERKSGFLTEHNCLSCKGSANEPHSPPVNWKKKGLGLWFHVGRTLPLHWPLVRQAGVNKAWAEGTDPWEAGLGWEANHSYFWIMTQSTQQEAFITSKVVLAL